MSENQHCDYEVRRWRRYGKDRLYVSVGEQRVGWCDLLTGAVTVEAAEHAEGVEQAIREWQAKGATPPEPTPPATATPSPLTPQQLVQADALYEKYQDVAPGVYASEYAYYANARNQAPQGEASKRQVNEPEWTDLALNKPGQAAREQARAEYAASKEQRGRLGAWLTKALDVKTDERNWRVGADGEETVGALLEKLNKHGFRVLHAVPIGERGSDIDHVLIGPPGVITINTKTHRDKSVWVGGNVVKVNGQNQPYVRNSRFEAERTEKLLSQRLRWAPPVTAALVFLTGTRTTRLTVKAPPEDVLVFPRSSLPGCFRQLEPVLSPEQVEAVFEVARRSTTWT